MVFIEKTGLEVSEHCVYFCMLYAMYIYIYIRAVNSIQVHLKK